MNMKSILNKDDRRVADLNRVVAECSRRRRLGSGNTRGIYGSGDMPVRIETRFCLIWDADFDVQINKRDLKLR